MAQTTLDILNIIIRIMPRGDEVEVELSPYSTGKEIINELVGAGVAPRNDQEGVAYVYELISKRSSQRIGDEKSLFDAGIKDGEILYLAPKLVAGNR